VTHFFQSWEELVIAAYRALAARFELEFSEIARRPGLTARARLDLYVESYFSPRWTEEEVAGAYIAFWALGRSQPRLRVEMDRLSETMRASLFPLISECAAERGVGAAEQICETFHFLLSGLWYETAVNPGSVRDPGPAQRARAFLDFAFAGS
jgi:BetI-type transcriptional repressor, C-terminal